MARLDSSENCLNFQKLHHYSVLAIMQKGPKVDTHNKPSGFVLFFKQEFKYKEKKKSPPVVHHLPHFTVKCKDKEIPETEEETTDGGFRET